MRGHRALASLDLGERWEKWGRWRTKRGTGALIGGALAAVLSVSCTACGSGGSPGTISVSVASGPVGTVVDLSGKAGTGCNPGKNWFGFEFERYGKLTKGPATGMTTPVVADGTWSATFAIPSYLGGSATRGPGAPTTAGRYQFAAEACKSHKWATAPFRVTPGAVASTGKAYVGIAATPDGQGYWLAQADGGVAAFGDAGSYGSLSAGKAHPGAWIVGIARTYDAHGYWLAGSDGTVYTLGDARSYGSPAGGKKTLPAPITGIAATPDGKGYWLLAANGTVFGFGDAHLDGTPNNFLAPYDAIAMRPAGGYIVTSASTAAAFLFPGGVLSGGGTGSALAALLVGTASSASGNGTWQVGRDGGVITTGDAAFYGSVPGESVVLKAPITGIAGDPDGHGYWLVGADGTVFPFGDAHSFGSAAPSAK